MSDEIDEERRELELEKLRMEIRKLEEEAEKVSLERRLYPAVIGSGLLLGLGTIFMLVFRLFF